MKTFRLMAFLFGLFLSLTSALTLTIRIGIRTAAGNPPLPTDSAVLMVFLVTSAVLAAITFNIVTEKTK